MTTQSSAESPSSPSRKRKLSDSESTPRPLPPRPAELSLVEKVRQMHEQKLRQSQQKHQEVLARQQEQLRQDKQRVLAQQQEQQQRLQNLHSFREHQQAQHEQLRVVAGDQQEQPQPPQGPQQQQHTMVPPNQATPVTQSSTEAPASSSVGSNSRPVATAEQEPVQQIDTEMMRQNPVLTQAVVPIATAPTGYHASQASPAALPTAMNPAQLQLQLFQAQLQQQRQAQLQHQFQQHIRQQQMQLQQHRHQQQQIQQQLQHHQQHPRHQPSPSSQRSQVDGGGRLSFTEPLAMPASIANEPPSASAVADPSLSRTSANTVNVSASISGNSTAATPPPPSSSYSDALSSIGEDPLKVAVVNEYDEINNYALRLEGSNAKLNEKVRQISMQNVTTAAKLNEQIKVYRATLEQVYDRRFEALAKVIMFSPDVRSRVKKIDQNTLGDIPHVLTACNLKCAQLAASIKTSETEVQKLRSAIDEAISSGNPAKLGQLHTLGKQISSCEQQIQSQRVERDDQFVLMIQYSRKLREVVRNHAVQNAKAKASSAASAGTTK